MKSELTPEDQRILERYLNRKNTPADTPSEDKLSPTFSGTFDFTIDNLVKNGRPFYSDKKINDQYVGVQLALEEAQKYIQSNNGTIATMPYLIAGKTQAVNTNSQGNKTRNDSHYLWKDWFTALSEEYIGIDEKGTFTTKGKPIIITLHGGGILTPERIKKAYTDGLTLQNATKLEKIEFTNILKGMLPNNEQIQIYTLEDIKNNKIITPFGKYAIAQDFEKAKGYASGYHNKTTFLENPIVHARAGTKEYLDNYFELAKKSDDKTVGCWHRFNETDPKVPSGRLLFLNGSYYGLNGISSLSNDGRFVGVAPEAHRAKK